MLISKCSGLGRKKAARPQEIMISVLRSDGTVPSTAIDTATTTFLNDMQTFRCRSKSCKPRRGSEPRRAAGLILARVLSGSLIRKHSKQLYPCPEKDLTHDIGGHSAFKT